jgi:hypothetical protein
VSRRPRDLPVPMRGASTRARGLRPRRVPAPLAKARSRMWPSAFLHGVGTPEVSNISRLNTRPMCAPVNASPPSSRTAAHDSESAWLAMPSPSGSFIHDTSPVLPAHASSCKGACSCRRRRAGRLHPLRAGRFSAPGVRRSRRSHGTLRWAACAGPRSGASCDPPTTRRC